MDTYKMGTSWPVLGTSPAYKQTNWLKQLIRDLCSGRAVDKLIFIFKTVLKFCLILQWQLHRASVARNDQSQVAAYGY